MKKNVTEANIAHDTSCAKKWIGLQSCYNNILAYYFIFIRPLRSLSVVYARLSLVHKSQNMVEGKGFGYEMFCVGV